MASLFLVSALIGTAAAAGPRLTIELYQVSCPSYSYVPANDSYNNATYDQTDGHTGELNTASNRGTAALSDIDSHCTAVSGWQFNLHSGSAGGALVADSPLTTVTGGTPHVSVLLSDTDTTTARTGSGIWVAEVIPAGYGFAGLRCYTDIMYSDNSENVNGVDDNVTTVYCLAFNVGRTLTITANNQAKTYGTALALGSTGFSTSGLLAGDSVSSVTLTSAGSAATASVGNYPIVPSAAAGVGLTHYASTKYVDGNLAVSAKGLTITASNQGKIYGETLNLGTTLFSKSGLVNSDSVSGVTLTSAGAVAGAAAGSYPIAPTVAVGSGLSNYAISYVNGSLAVATKGLTVTASNQSKVYGATLDLGNSAFTTSGLINGNTVSTVTLTSAGAAAGAAVGNYPIAPTAAVGTGLSNYAITYANGTLAVSTKGLTITATNKSKVYGSTLALGTTSFTEVGLLPGDSITGVTLTSTGAAAGAAVGNYPIVASAVTGTGLAGYAITYVDGTLGVTKAMLTVTAPNATKLEGAANPALTPTYAGFASGDTAASLTTEPSCSTTAVTASLVGIFPVTCSGGVSANYDFTYVDGTLTVVLGTLDHIVISPDPATIVAGTTQAYTAEGFDSQGNSLGDVTASTKFTIDGSGSACAVTECGSTIVAVYTVTGADGELTDTAILNVVAAATPAPTPVPSASASGSQTILGATSAPSATPPATSSQSNGSGTGTPLFALLICLAFGSLAMLMVEKQRRAIRR
jgi:hypothetical protein